MTPAGLSLTSTFHHRTRPASQAVIVALAFYLFAGTIEASLIRIVQPTEMELDWVSDMVLSAALGTAVYLWLHLRATRLALTEREREQLVIQTQLSLAEGMQRRLLPPVPLPAQGFEWAATLTPAGSIGGDFYDFAEPSPNVRVMLIADVSGKGISAAMALTLLRATFRNVARDTTDPAQLATRMSRAFYGEWHGAPYVTCVIARVDLSERMLTYVNAGHPPGLLVRGNGGRDLWEGGPPLGLIDGADYREECLTVQAGDVCVLMTDGVTESFDDLSSSFSTLVAGIASRRPRSAANICDTLMSRAVEGSGPHGVHDWTDDRTVVVFTLS